jgi:hypothetical protein
MRFPQHSMSVTRRGEKEARLGAFIVRGIESVTAQEESGAEPEERAVLAIARSVQSPVIKSIAALAHEIAAARCSVRIILARTDRAALSDALIAAQAAGLDCEVRLARNPRLIEAHEQLVLGRRTCWIGDTMRRDPVTCDAYESFVEDVPEIAAAARLTFERLWSDGEPLSWHAPVVAAAALSTPKAIGPDAIPARRP